MDCRMIDRIDVAVTECERFMGKALRYKDRLLDAEYPMNTKEGGACKRASMDLTRALAELRKY